MPTENLGHALRMFRSMCARAGRAGWLVRRSYSMHFQRIPAARKYLSEMARVARLTGMELSRVCPRPGEDGEIEAARAAGDHRRALTLLMARHGDGIYRFAMAMTHDRNLAEEVRQQVFVEAYRDVGNLAAGSSLRSSIFGIARHRCLDAVHARTRWNQRYKNRLLEEPEQDDCEPELEFDRGRLVRVLAACLDRLAPAAREAVVLRYHQELSYDEAAEIAGERPGTLRRRVSRALPVLRRCVQITLRPGVS
ncbi:MAG: RNA polymerase sigma factor [Deltaproteobacteria bacterium]|nr:MAG: RNA polymerase sigma factor [Deltaproteobacteria bacterium]